MKIEKSKLPESFDAIDWAEEFVRMNKENPEISKCENTMTTWFANALMRGYDEHSRRELVLDDTREPTIKSRIQCVWTWPDHFAHYLDGGEHQICITANGWKGKILGFIFRAKENY